MTYLKSCNNMVRITFYFVNKTVLPYTNSGLFINMTVWYNYLTDN